MEAKLKIGLAQFAGGAVALSAATLGGIALYTFLGWDGRAFLVAGLAIVLGGAWAVCLGLYQDELAEWIEARSKSKADPRPNAWKDPI